MLALGMRVAIQVARTGSSGFAFLRGGTQERWVGTMYGTGVILAALAPAAARMLPGPLAVLGYPSLRAVGLALFVLGLLGTIWAQLVMGNSWRIGVDSSERTGLITGGPFRLVRNPIFSCTLLCVLGSAVAVPSILSIVALGMTLIATELQVRFIEEPYLVKSHGQNYQSWAAGVGRFVPGFGRGVKGPA